MERGGRSRYHLAGRGRHRRAAIGFAAIHEAFSADSSPLAQGSGTPVRDHLEFLRQFRRQFETTGAVAPSSRFLAAAMTGPLSRRTKPARILEVGPGTGAVTRKIV